MKKIVFATLRMADDMKKKHYPVDGNSFIEYEGEVYYAINAVLAKTMKSNDEIKVVLIQTEGGDQAGEKNACLYKNELNSLNVCGASITYVDIKSPFTENEEKFKKLYLDLIRTLEQDAELYTDVTFGPKSLPLTIFAVLQFGEKFFDCSIGNVIYLKADHATVVENGISVNRIKPNSQKICDYTPLYMINRITNTISAKTGEKAISAVQIMFQG